MKFAFLFSMLVSLGALAQNTPILSEIMKGPDFIGHLPQQIQWSPNGENIFYVKDSNDGQKHYSYSVKNKATNLIEKDKRVVLPNVPRRMYSRNHLYTVQHGKLIQIDKEGAIHPILNIQNRISNVQHVLNEDRVYFQQKNDLYMFDVNKGYLKQISAVSKDQNKEDKSSKYLSDQEKQLFIDRTKNNDDDEESKDLAMINTRGMSIQSIQISPNEDFIAFRLSKNTQPPYTDVMQFLSEDGFSKVQKARPKVGTVEPPNMSFGIYSFEKDTTIQLDFSFLPGIKKAPEYYKDYDRSIELEENKALIIHRGVFSPDGSKVLISIKSFDNKDRWLVSYNLNSNTSVIVDHQHSKAWIGGPGISSWNYYKGNIGWIDNQRVYFQSEESGFSHLYTFNVVTKEKVSLTSGNWEVHAAELSMNSSTFYITANKSHPGNRSFYHLNIKTKALTPVLTSDGAYEVQISPDEKTLAIRYSYKNKPWELYTSKNAKGAQPVQITKSTTRQFDSYDWTTPEIVEILTESGLHSNARVYKPADSLKNGAAVIFVHGAGYLQNVHNYWSGYYREYMFHHILLAQGYTILDIDYRASKGYGIDHRTSIYRHMGNADLDDQLFGKKWLVKNLNIDPNRVGIYGGSYGGFITLMALFKHPGEFQCGGALRSVTDWAHYNHPYTSNILNTPELDSIAYKRSSPIYFADGLQDRLIMFHGMVDDNVQYQDIIRLSQRLIELGKEDWDLASYPIEAHSFSTPTSWTDEYRRLLKMFNEELSKP